MYTQWWLAMCFDCACIFFLNKCTFRSVSVKNEIAGCDTQPFEGIEKPAGGTGVRRVRLLPPGAQAQRHARSPARPLPLSPSHFISHFFGSIIITVIEWGRNCRPRRASPAVQRHVNKAFVWIILTSFFPRHSKQSHSSPRPPAEKEKQTFESWPNNESDAHHYTNDDGGDGGGKTGGEGTGWT